MQKQILFKKDMIDLQKIVTNKILWLGKKE